MPRDAGAAARALEDPIERFAGDLELSLLAARYEGQSAEAILADAIGREFRGRIALSSSFGADAAVLLALIADVDKATPVLFLETGMLFAETLDYQRDVAERLGLSDVRLLRPDAAERAVEDPSDRLHQSDTDACCDLRKVRPLERALSHFDAWITGRKRGQSTERARMPIVERDEAGRIKLNPLATWTTEQVVAERARRALPPHPLVAKGFPSIGCAPCTSPVADGEDARAGRWRGQEKTECGIHFVNGRLVRTSAGS